MAPFSIASPRKDALLCLVLAQWLSPVLGFPPQPQVRLSRVNSVTLQKGSGQIDQVVPLADGGFAVRDSDFDNEQQQALEIFSRNGDFRQKVGTFGRAPGQYFRLFELARQSNSTIWAADLVGRINRYTPTGELLNTILIQNPGYHVKGLVLDEAWGFFYLAGCKAKQTYLDRGCVLVHQYSLEKGGYLRSFLDTDPEALQKNLLSLESYKIDLDGEGNIFAIDAPILKLFRINTASGKIQSFAIRSRVARPIAALRPGVSIAEIHEASESAFLVDRALVVGQFVVVSIRRPRQAGHLLQVFTTAGKQLVMDLESPGKLVGKTTAGNLYFARKGPQGFEMSEYRLENH